MKKKLLVFILVLSTFYSLFAVNTSLLVIQKNGLETVSAATKTIENEILDTLFEEGHIVSNSPIIKSSEYDEKSPEAFFDALEGCMDYFVEVTINYDLKDSKFPDGLLVSNISYIHYSIKNVWTGNLLISSEDIKPANIKNDANGLKKFAVLIGNNINSDIINIQKNKKR